MIGVVGPADSAQLALAVATEEGLGQLVIARAYESIDEAPSLARELDSICRVLLFTGRVPYVLGRRSANLRASLLFVPHSGTDLYRTLVQILREHGGHLPRMSLDTIEPEIAKEISEDLGLDVHSHLLPLDMNGDADRIHSAPDIANFHRQAFASREVDICVTCVGAVYRELQSAGIPAWRIAHTKSAMREALRNAHLVARIAVTEGTQPAAVILQLPAVRARSAEAAGDYEAQRRRLRTREAALDLAERLQGRLADIDDETFMVNTSRATVDAALARLVEGHVGPLELRGLPEDVQVGVGLGASVAAAEDNARRALAMGRGPRDIHVAFPDGEVIRAAIGGPPTSYNLREMSEPSAALARQLGLGPLAVARLTGALRQVDPSGVTATELAQAYGIRARSARRLMTTLQRAGIATQLRRQGGPRAGRPQTVYRINLDRLLSSDLS